MSGLDVASGIAGLLSLAVEVSKAITQYVIDVKNQSRVVQELKTELDLLGTVLSGLADFIRSEQAKGRKYNEDSVLMQAVSECTRRIESIGDTLGVSATGRFKRTLNKLKWPFEQKEVLQMMDNLRQYRETFQFAMTIRTNAFLSETWTEAHESLQKLQKNFDKVCDLKREIGESFDDTLAKSQQLQKIISILPAMLQQSADLRELTQASRFNEKMEQEKRTDTILNWLAPLSHEHIEAQQRRAPDTCKWLLENESFILWSTSGYDCRDFLCQGGPGVGKTVLCSLVYDHLRTKYKNENVAVIHYYFNLAKQQAQTAETLARSIVRQLCSRSMPLSVIEFYQNSRNDLKDFTWLQELEDILHRVAATFDQCFFIIDAFDEADPRKRTAMLKLLESIRSSTRNVKFFATSRPTVRLDLFQSAVKLKVRADKNDLRRFLSDKIGAHHRSAELVDPVLEEQILNRLCEHADGVFLLPAMQIEQILDDAGSPGDVEEALETLPSEPDKVFASTIERINKFSGSIKVLAFKTLMWVSHAQRPLSISELQHAMAVRLDGGDVNERNVSAQSTIIESCCGLIEVDRQTSLVRFIHGSISEYFRRKDHGFFSDPELEIVKVCLKYMTMDQPRLLSFKSRVEFVKELDNFPFLEYASSFWGLHARGLPVEGYEDLALSFFSSSSHLLVNARVRDIKTPEFRKWKDRMMAWSISGGAGISLAASFGLADLTKLLIEQSPNPALDARNMYGSTPLHEVAIFGYEDTAEVLIAHNADMLEANRGKATPFYLAVCHGQINMCRILLRLGKEKLDIAYDEQLNVKCKGGNTALHKAADTGDGAMVEFLLQSGAEIDIRKEQGLTPLHIAARKGYCDIVRLLVLAGASCMAEDDDSLTPLDFAALFGHADVVEFLLKQRIDVNHTSRDAWSALHRAASSGNDTIAGLLLAGGASISSAGRSGLTPFHAAVKSGNLDTVKTILHFDETLTSKLIQDKDRRNDNGLKMAFYASHYHIYEYLRDLEFRNLSNASALIVDPLLPLSQAIEQGSLSRVQQILQERPQWLMSRDNFDQAPLHTAFRTQQWEIADFLLNQGASIDSRGHHGWTPIHIAAQIGSFRMTELALDWRANIYLKSQTKQSVLHKATSARSTSVLTLLLQLGCSPYDRNDRGMTPVHVAARLNFLEGIQIMTQPQHGGLDLLLMTDVHGRTPRDWAYRGGHLELSSYLRDEERRAKSRVRVGVHSSGNTSLNGTPGTLSRTSTIESLHRRSISNSLLLSPPLGHRSLSRESTTSLASTEADDLAVLGLDRSFSVSPSPSRSHAVTPDLAATAGTPSRRTPTPAQDFYMTERERIDDSLQLELESE